MIDRLKNRIKFSLERMILRGTHYRLFVMTALIGIVSLGAGMLVFQATTDFATAGEAIWWAFLRLTDPGYLGDDKGIMLATVSTIVTILGYVLFMGSLIAILTQWLNATVARLESGLTPIIMDNHILILGWTNRTPTIVQELLLSEGRVKRFLRRHGARKLRIVILSEVVGAALRYELRDYLGSDWDERQIIFRSGTPLHLEHLERVDFLHAAAIILPGSDFALGGTHTADMRTIKTLLSISNRSVLEDTTALPLLVAEIFDARKISVAKAAYQGKIEILASDATISLLIAQNVRHRWLSHIYSELLTHGEGNEIFIRELPDFVGIPLQNMIDAFPKAILFGVLRNDGKSEVLMMNPPDGFTTSAKDRYIFLARGYKDTEPLTGYTPQSTKRGVSSEISAMKTNRRILLMGWSNKIPALIHEFDNYKNETFEIEILSSLPIAQRNDQMAKYALRPQRVKIQQLEGDYAAPSDLAKINPGRYDNIVIVGSDWLDSKEEADARTILGHQLLQQMFSGKKSKPEILVELLDPENHALFQNKTEEVLVSPMILSHILAHVALRPDLNAVFKELFSSGGAEIFLRPADCYELNGRELSFRQVQHAVALHGEIALGVRIDAESPAKSGGIELNPDREKRWTLRAEDEIVVLTTYV